MLCSNCSLYLEPEPGNKCGGCVLFEGPVFAEGYCDYWEPNE
ncbi:high-potential iron-sulfur protein [Fodinibius sp.]